MANRKSVRYPIAITCYVTAKTGSYIDRMSRRQECARGEQILFLIHALTHIWICSLIDVFSTQAARAVRNQEAGVYTSNFAGSVWRIVSKTGLTRRSCCLLSLALPLTVAVLAQ